MIRIYSVLFFFFLTNPTFSQEFVVKNVDGHIVFILDEQIKILENFDIFSNINGSFRLYGDSTSLFFRYDDNLGYIHNENCPEDSCDYFLKNIIDYTDNNENSNNIISRLLKPFYSFKHHDKIIDGMVMSDKSQVSRNILDTNIIYLPDLEIISNYPFQIDFSSILNFNQNSSITYKVLIKDRLTSKVISNFSIYDSFFTFNPKSVNNALFFYWDIEISQNTSSKIISFSIREKNIDKNLKKILTELKNKAIQESKTDNINHQIVFIEFLLSIDMFANAAYFLDVFIESNRHKKLIYYKEEYLVGE